ncbi:hypothetical protein BT69DRAFT_1346221 [Atractiella rhizophila]|nr:hypothetical protein BT69DRAFT_1346221 [Atractiella rhizophila]
MSCRFCGSRLHPSWLECVSCGADNDLRLGNEWKQCTYCNTVIPAQRLTCSFCLHPQVDGGGLRLTQPRHLPARCIYCYDTCPGGAPGALSICLACEMTRVRPSTAPPLQYDADYQNFVRAASRPFTIPTPAPMCRRPSSCPVGYTMDDWDDFVADQDDPTRGRVYPWDWMWSGPTHGSCSRCGATTRLDDQYCRRCGARPRTRHRNWYSGRRRRRLGY